ncbi:aryl-alcohol dehydrogenase [Xylariaceae sp. FL0594]|nr:aryl-alcohol dehydrogenase [Xylariaceae sp. FL0594]
MYLPSYDFVIVGGGTAGLVLANRLSEDGTQTVLVLEAGSDQSENLNAKIPARYAMLLNSDMDWGFTTVPQPNLLNRTIPLNQGRALGGSSVINAQVYAPPTSDIVDSWASLGNEDWDWTSFRRFHEMAYTYPRIPASEWETLGLKHWPLGNDNSTSGPIKTSFPLPSHPIRKAWAETFENLGYGKEADDGPLYPTSVGAFSPLASVDPVSCERSQAAGAYYKPLMNPRRENIDLRTNATVEKVLFSHDDQEEETTIPKAIGVQYRRDATTHRVLARKEVIVSAGALQSPKILELSGIGDRAILGNHGIDVLRHLKGVGEGLQDHLVVDVVFEAADDLQTRDANIRREPEAVKQAMDEYESKQSGILTSSGLLTAAYMPLLKKDGGEEQQRLRNLLEANRPKQSDEETGSSALYKIANEAILSPAAPSGVYIASLGQNPQASDPVTGARSLDVLPGSHLTLVGILSHPVSRGSVHIHSRNPSDGPVIDPKYLSNPVDVEVFAQHMLNIQLLASSPLLNRLLKHPLTHSRPMSVMRDKVDAERYVRLRAASMWHPAGTCAMMAEDMGGVVDKELKVHGVRNLRVVDASVIPVLPPGSLQSAVYGVAEKAAEMIRREYGLK